MEKDSDFRSPRKKRTRRHDDASVPGPSKRFLKMSEEDMADISKVFVPSNTKKNTDWAVSCFCDWRSVCNAFTMKGSVFAGTIFLKSRCC